VQIIEGPLTPLLRVLFYREIKTG